VRSVEWGAIYCEVGRVAKAIPEAIAKIRNRGIATIPHAHTTSTFSDVGLCGET
jgi:hypothetical protein